MVEFSLQRIFDFKPQILRKGEMKRKICLALVLVVVFTANLYAGKEPVKDTPKARSEEMEIKDELVSLQEEAKQLETEIKKIENEAKPLKKKLANIRKKMKLAKEDLKDLRQEAKEKAK